MFLVSDSIRERHKVIEKYLDTDEASIAILLAAADFERSVKRAILALGQSPTKDIKEKLIGRRFHGPEAFKSAWRAEVQRRHDVDLANGVVRNWSEFVQAYECRNRLIHGTTNRMTTAYASRAARKILAASSAVHKFAADRAHDLDKRIVRRSAVHRSQRWRHELGALVIIV
ncbi:MAG: hypothetical protein DCF16_08190 [Alphaproteobacteria bacterium]|nr:MAG: hypothetical protein DCF16_08190 [Alphaproteobacteria bacterium]